MTAGTGRDFQASERIRRLSAHAAIVERFRGIDERREEFIEELLEVASIPAPTFAEAERAAWVRRKLEHAGLANLRSDEAGNVFGSHPGAGPPVVVAAHLDTVFAAAEDHSAHRREGRICGRGIGDNSLGLVALTALAELVKGLDLESEVVFAATMGEEGLGDLRGVRKLIEGFRGRTPAAFIAVEGHFLGRVVNTSVGSRRFRISFSGPGGHSWHDFGRPSAVAAAAQVAHLLSSLALPSTERATLNVGRISGGEGVNVIARSAFLEVDLRSASQVTLDGLECDLRKVVDDSRREGLSVNVETIGDRPAGSIPAGAPLVQAAMSSLEALGIEAELAAASTDANLPVSCGIPAISVGVSRGGGMHSPEEWIEEGLIPAGLKHLLSLTVAVAGLRS